MSTSADVDVVRLREMRDQFTRFMLSYKFGVDEVMTKINILREEFNHIHSYNPIEHVSSRLKSAQSIVSKVQRKGVTMTFAEMRNEIHDIAGIRITCSFLSDIYTVRNMLIAQRDITVLSERDYIAEPKPNGYKSLHLIITVPVFMSDRVEEVVVEVQIRTIAMDFWASLEHKIYYKYNKEVPSELLLELKQAAEVANRLDEKMEHLHNQMLEIKSENGESASEGFPASDLLGIMPSNSLIQALMGSIRR